MDRIDRIAKVKRKTSETEIEAVLNLDGKGNAKIDCPIGFFRHMLETFSKHSLFDIELNAKGDTEVDQHHLVEDTGIVLGAALLQALGEKKGIKRTGSALYPMDETLASAAVDLAGRSFLYYEPKLSGIPLVSADSQGRSSPFQTDTTADFWQAFCSQAACTLHLEIIRGRSDHHKIEALFKAAARALRDACERDPRIENIIPSTKGSLDGQFNAPGLNLPGGKPGGKNDDGGVFIC